MEMRLAWSANDTGPRPLVTEPRIQEDSTHPREASYRQSELERVGQVCWPSTAWNAGRRRLGHRHRRLEELAELRQLHRVIDHARVVEQLCTVLCRALLPNTPRQPAAAIIWPHFQLELD